MRQILVWAVRILPFAYMALIWLLSSLPHNAVVELPDSAVDRFIKESLHLVEFGILYILLFFAALTLDKFTPVMGFALMAIAGLYGVIDEIHQSFVPYRSATLIDVIKDVIGVLVASHFMHNAYFSGRFPKLRDKLIQAERYLKG
ncbi:VanZ family protein [Mesobacillus harenae]|uniref:VanZ family protein n=1 Tax=Mesobacillus harenae TaxID=2213203 RepID=UPI001580293F|nr:VanZ family protein [Mesobacillus harenae]